MIRWGWLGRPWFLLSVAVLGVNDHVLKYRFPGWSTGKASDVAGVVVLATLAAVVLGPTRGVGLVGVGFTLLKTVPGVAELVAPVLGGAPLRDATDLVALVALVPVAVVLRRSEHAVDARTPPGPGGVEQRSSVGRPGEGRWRRAVGSTVPLLGALTAVFLTTATSCAPQDAVLEVTARGGSLYALVARGHEPPQWAQSDDGGRSWHRAEAEPSGREKPDEIDAYADEPLLGPLTACTSAGVCYRLRDQSIIERQDPGGPWVEDLRLGSRQLDEADTGCRGGARGILASVAVSSATPPDVVVSFGAEGVLVRHGDSGWTRVGVLGAPPPDAGLAEWARVFVVIGIGPLLALGLWMRRDRLPAWRAAMVVGIGWWTLVVSVVFGLLLLSSGGSGPDPDPGITGAGIAAAAVGALVALLVARYLPRRTRVPVAGAHRPPQSNLPPPPAPPPPPPPPPPPDRSRTT